MDTCGIIIIMIIIANSNGNNNHKTYDWCESLFQMFAIRNFVHSQQVIVRVFQI